MGAYDKDFYAWTVEQAALLRAGRLHDLDHDRLAEEIESLGRSAKTELISRLGVLLAHLLKWQAQPHFRATSWRLTIEEQRDQIRGHLDDNPSLKHSLAGSFARGYRSGLRRAQLESGLGPQAFPPANPWTADQVLDDGFYPE